MPGSHAVWKKHERRHENLNSEFLTVDVYKCQFSMRNLCLSGLDDKVLVVMSFMTLLQSCTLNTFLFLQ